MLPATPAKSSARRSDCARRASVRSSPSAEFSGGVAPPVAFAVARLQCLRRPRPRSPSALSVGFFVARGTARDFCPRFETNQGFGLRKNPSFLVRERQSLYHCGARISMFRSVPPGRRITCRVETGRPEPGEDCQQGRITAMTSATTTGEAKPAANGTTSTIIPIILSPVFPFFATNR